MLPITIRKSANDISPSSLTGQGGNHTVGKTFQNSLGPAEMHSGNGFCQTD